MVVRKSKYTKEQIDFARKMNSKRFRIDIKDSPLFATLTDARKIAYKFSIEHHGIYLDIWENEKSRPGVTTYHYTTVGSVKMDRDGVFYYSVKNYPDRMELRKYRLNKDGTLGKKVYEHTTKYGGK